MLHHSDNGERPTKTVRETEAESVAFVVSQAVGLDTNTVSSEHIEIYAGCSKATFATSLDASSTPPRPLFLRFSATSQGRTVSYQPATTFREGGAAARRGRFLTVAVLICGAEIRTLTAQTVRQSCDLFNILR